jgi:AbrB family looped-hinge helix DNA binding protein
MKIALRENGRITLPAKWRRADGIRRGQQFAVHRIRAGEYLLKRTAAKSHAGVLRWLLDCPYKGWFKPIPSATIKEA